MFETYSYIKLKVNKTKCKKLNKIKQKLNNILEFRERKKHKSILN